MASRLSPDNLMQKENFVVIGSNSFSGAHFIDYVLRDNPSAMIAAVSRSDEYESIFLPYKQTAPARVRFHQLNLNYDTDRIVSLAQELEADYIVNFAAQGMVAESWENPEQWFQTNCISLVTLADRLVHEKVNLKRFVQISSPEVYGSSRGETEENVRFSPSSPYAAAKAAGDLGLYPFFLHKGLPLVYTRATNVYGRCQQPYRIIPRIVLAVRNGEKMQLHGGGRAVKSYIHIRDVCDATLRAARNGRNGEVYHISPDGNGISIYDLVEKICGRMGQKMDDYVEIANERPGQDPAYVINSDKIRRELDWCPQIRLEEGIDEVISWVDDNYTELSEVPHQYVHKV